MSNQSEFFFVIQPRSPLVFRSGELFGNGAAPGASLGWPMPSTAAGAARAALADATDRVPAVGKPETHAALRKIAEAGPFLTAWRINGDAIPTEIVWYAPKPADALYVKVPRRGITLRRLHPRSEDRTSDLPFSLVPVGEASADAPAKACEANPFWSWSSMLDWLNGEEQSDIGTLDTGEQASPGPQRDSRAQLAIDPTRHVSIDGTLRQTTALGFGVRPNGLSQKHVSAYAMGLGVRLQCDEAASEKLNGTVCRMGADAKTVRYKKSIAPSAVDTKSALDSSLQALKCGDVFRLILVTAGVFNAGWHPDWLHPSESNAGPSMLRGDLPIIGTSVTLVAAAVEKSTWHSRWSMEHNHALASLRVVPAGTVYWFRFDEQPPAHWHRTLWLRSICDDTQNKLDGCALAVLGTISNTEPEAEQ